MDNETESGKHGKDLDEGPAPLEHAEATSKSSGEAEFDESASLEEYVVEQEQNVRDLSSFSCLCRLAALSNMYLHVPWLKYITVLYSCSVVNGIMHGQVLYQVPGVRLQFVSEV